MDLRYIDPQARVLTTFTSNKSNHQSMAAGAAIKGNGPTALFVSKNPEKPKKVSVDLTGQHYCTISK